MEALFNILMSSSLISLTVWIAKRNPILAGFVVSLPISTLITLALVKIQGHEPESPFELAKSIFVAVPATLLFFVPFLLAGKLRLSFWACYWLGAFLLTTSYFIHKSITGIWIR